MFNKRVGTLLALVLASSMAMSGPAAVMAASGNSGGTSQLQTREDQDDGEEEEKEEFEEKADDVNADAEEDKSDVGNEEEPAGEEVNEASDPEWQEEEPEEEEPGEEVKDSSEKKDKKDSAEDKKEKKDKKSDKSDKEEAVEKKEKSAPRAGDSENNEACPFTISGGAINKDYVFNESTKQLIISNNTAMTVSTVSAGSVVSQGSIVVASAEGANLTLSNLHINTSPALQVGNAAKPVYIHLDGHNELSGIQIDNAEVRMDGLKGVGGVLKSRARDGRVVVESPTSHPVVISGGNIQASFKPQPENVKGNKVYAVSVNGLSENRAYSIKIKELKAEVSLNSYSYGNSIIADENGKVVMYLPEGPVQVFLNDVGYEGTVLSGNGSELSKIEVTPTTTPTALPTNTPSSIPSDTPAGPDQEAKNADNKIFWIEEGKTYRAGVLQFCAVGAAYSPDDYGSEVQGLLFNKARPGATRYKPVSWSVGTGNSVSEKGKWSKYSEARTASSVSGSNSNSPTGYLFRDSFTLSTNQTSDVPYTLKVNYQKESYNGRKWVKVNGNDAVDTKEVHFNIRNTDITSTVTGTPRPTSTTYVRSGVTSSALRRDVSSNARNARTSDDTPIGTMIFLMFAAAGSGVVIFRRKTRS